MEHPVFRTIQKLREAYLKMGFREVINPLFIEEEEVYKQFGEEAPVILDRCYYLAGLPRPDIGLSKERIEQIRSIGVPIDGKVDDLKSMLREYKVGRISSDDLVEQIAHVLGIEGNKAAKLLELFPELRELKPVPTKLTLRSHMTAGWFLTLAEIQHKLPTPIKLFSVDRVFRREQREDERRVRSHHSASCVVMDKDASVETGRDVAGKLLSFFGFDEIEIRRKAVSSRYYEDGSEHEVFIKLGDEFIEVADFGMYSRRALEAYKIRMPVMNLGLGVERLAMVLEGVGDMRTLLYPWREWKLSDEEIASMIKIDVRPSTAQGEEIWKAIVKVCEDKGSEKSPCEFVAWEGELCGRKVRVYVLEREDGTTLCGPAYLNEFLVKEGCILALPREGKWSRIASGGIRTGIRFIDSFAAYAAAKIEEMACKGEGWEGRVRMVRSPSDVNVKIDDAAVRYITSHGGKIDVRGPMFVTVRSEMR